MLIPRCTIVERCFGSGNGPAQVRCCAHVEIERRPAEHRFLRKSRRWSTAALEKVLVSFGMPKMGIGRGVSSDRVANHQAIELGRGATEPICIGSVATIIVWHDLRVEPLLILLSYWELVTASRDLNYICV